MPNILRDSQGAPIPQYQTADGTAFEPWLGASGGGRVLLYDAAGNPLLLKTPTGETQKALGVAGYGYDGAGWRAVRVGADGRPEVTLYGSRARISSAPVVGVKTVTSTAAEIFAGASRKVGRSVLMIRNRSFAVRIRVGPSTVTDTTGWGIEPEAVLVLGFDPAADVPIYAVSEAGNVEVEVFEA